MSMLTGWMNALLSGFLLGWNYASPVPPLSEAQEAHFARIFRWDATASRPIPPVSQAVMNCDIKRLQELRAQGAYIRLQHEVQRANFYGQVDCVEWLLTQGATLRPREYYYAIMNGHLDMVRWWHRSPFYLQGHVRGWSADYGEPMLLALRSGNLDLVRYLQKRGETLPTGPEQIAEVWNGVIEGGHWRIWQWLIQEQGWSFEQDDYLNTYDHAFKLALLAGNFERVQGMLNMGYSIAHRKDKSRLLLYAAHGGSLPAVRWLLAQGIPLAPSVAKYTYEDAMAVGYYGHSNFVSGPVYGIVVAGTNSPTSWLKFAPTALEEAQTWGHQDLAQWLTKQGAVPLAGKISAVEAQAAMPPVSDQIIRPTKELVPSSLRMQIYNDYSETVASRLRVTPYAVLHDELLDTPYILDSTSPFLNALRMENLPLVQYMLLRYPDLLMERQTLFGDGAPLHLAAELGSIELTRFLLEQGADPLDLDAWKRTPADLVDQYYAPAVTRLLRQAEPRAKMLPETLTEVSGQ